MQPILTSSMKRFLPILLLCLTNGLVCHNAHAEENKPLYVYLSNGGLDVFPAEVLKYYEETAGELRITLFTDSVVSYPLSEIDSLGSKPSRLPVFTSFKFNNKYNDQVYTDVEAIVSADSVKAEVGAIGKRLTPSFKLDSDEAVAYVKGVKQESKVSRLRFANPVVYTLALPGQRILKNHKIQDEMWSQDSEVIETAPVELTADMLSTNAPANYSKEGLESMLDSNPSTFFHSTWGSGQYEKLPLDVHPYIDINLPEALSKFRFSYTTRPDVSDRNPMEFSLQASYDNGYSWVEIRTLSAEADGMPSSGRGVSYTSPIISAAEPFTLLRLEMTRASYKNYLCLAEFSIEKVTRQETIEGGLISPAIYGWEWVPYGREVPVCVTWLGDVAGRVPRIDINIEGGRLPADKETYLNASFSIDGAGIFPDMQDSVKIKGRGNTSWTGSAYGKNPYRLKFASSVKPFGLTKGKNWVLLANRQKGSMMANAMAMKVAAMVETAGANRIIPVDLYLNGDYRGSYCFTQHVGLANNSIDLEDETNATLLELDSYYDETYKFRSSYYSLPVNIKDPDLSEMSNSEEHFELIKADFNKLTKATYSGGSEYDQLVDVDMLARFLLVNELVVNLELRHPKSCFLYKEDLFALHSRYIFGPVWDFDWAFGYETTSEYCTSVPEQGYFSTFGSSIFKHLRFNSELVGRAYYKEWSDFMNLHLDELLEYVDDYYQFAKPSFIRNAQIWSDGSSYATIAANTRDWLERRAKYAYANIEAYDLDEPLPITVGDVNLDGYISVADVVCVVNHILGSENETFSFEQADADGNQEISVNDIVHVLSLAMNQSAVSSRQLLLPHAEGGIGISTFEASPDEVANVPLHLSIKSEGYTATQFDITLPAEAQLSDICLPQELAGFTLHLQQIDETTYRAMLYSPNGKSLPTSASALTLQLFLQDTVADGEKVVSISNALLTDKRGEDNRLSPCSARFDMKEPTGIHSATEERLLNEPAGNIYNSAGKLIRSNSASLKGLERGVYIVNGKKVIL